MNTHQFEVIGHIESPYKEKFAIPRQPGLVQDGGGRLVLHSPFSHPDSVRGLEQFSYIWVIFVFHQTASGGWKPLVRPPRLGGNAKIGVFATRSTFRPNPIGMSLIELKGVTIEKNSVTLELGSLDLVDGTPVIDIKPYLPFAESHPEAKAGFAQSAPANDMEVIFTSQASAQLTQYQAKYPQLARFIAQVLAQDPRPAYKKQSCENRDYAVHLLDFNVCWRIVNNITEVFAVDLR
ncbi:tRNA (N6-threonylcarbamoyladenosine(37)-N6)-methyltransferase TrmO [Moellerella wisconsensis]|uniref:tRNA (N6-threonylcarbamoyladenosine(37)-N6)-methyltransferase TrmO n=2 Tax=Moellerella wisconsensis TaxID=158849 RepID=A0ACD3Y9R2_9GAMM|nr:tRNA (N6-threonylcarbamoyladenosine(37)-N6)-methyltransferase TrmO [Moellerella wisconsensis]KLN97625.1 tRNA (adenine(37)-N6)-methyltransferase [Moellerella wisconsensis]UNH24715.1 tRNA (N6-threonylcarbamoyladenosine(37)-N6)-methyltransferase TrmO [Moellerella wisconsensis]UNH27822.1 tRNA (N6-threonylcarbamoyladenosine(37)-N6)-methyltransferase TrmO [Moellerella wisconsensis]UNH31318.1 tRNA (N6-threonylcarbamoyladenosine(37)-N6)-methyltransferase TrmO [Moellerella wisconsensis]UNH39441.1 tR